MQLLLIVLNKVEKLDDLLESFMEQGFIGATILSSNGMMKELAKNSEDFPIFGALRFQLNLDREENKTIFMVLKDDQVETVKKIIRKVIGDISKPDSAIVFTLPILSAEGIGF